MGACKFVSQCRFRSSSNRPFEEEDATVWARYTSAQFDQGAGRHACNNPYARDLDEKLYMDMKKSKVWQAPHNKFIDMIKPSFAAIDEDEDMDAILARTHIILITDCGIYYRVASTSKDPISFIQWDDNEPMDLMTASQKPIFKQYKMQPHVHNYPASYLEDLAWSQTLIRRLLNGEPVPRSHTRLRPTSLFGSSNARASCEIKLIVNLTETWFNFSCKPSRKLQHSK